MTHEQHSPDDSPFPISTTVVRDVLKKLRSPEGRQHYLIEMSRHDGMRDWVNNMRNSAAPYGERAQAEVLDGAVAMFAVIMEQAQRKGMLLGSDISSEHATATYERFMTSSLTDSNFVKSLISHVNWVGLDEPALGPFFYELCNPKYAPIAQRVYKIVGLLGVYWMLGGRLHE